MRYPLMPTGVEHVYVPPELETLFEYALPSDAYGR